jgi:O-antigen ligase
MAWNGIAASLVIFATVLSVWLFASAEPAAYHAIGFLVLGGLVCWLFAQTACSPTPIRTPLSVLFLVLLLLFGMLQTVQVPVSWASRISRLSPVAAKSLDWYHSLSVMQDPSEETDLTRPSLQHPVPETTRIPLSVAPNATRTAMALLSFYLAAFLVTANCLTSWRGIRMATRVLVISGVVLAVASIAHKFSGSGELLWVHLPRYRGASFGPFSNRNHFAAHTNMLFGLALALLMSSGRIREMWRQEYWRERFIYLTTGRASRIGLIAFSLMLLGGATFLSLSRGGMLSLTVSIGVLALVATRQGQRAPLPRGFLLSIVLLVAAAVLWLGWEPIVGRLATLGPLIRDIREDGRIISTWDTLKLFFQSPLLGCGFGAFEYAFPMFQHLNPGELRFLHAHNDWAQLLAEGGIAGGLLTLGAIAALLQTCRRRVSENLPSYALNFSIGIGVAILSIVLHSLVDYSLHKPANALLLSVLAGLLVAALHLERQEEKTWDMDPADQPEPAADEADKPCRPARFLYMLLLLIAVLHMTNQLPAMRKGMAVSRFEYFRRLYDKLSSPVLKVQAVAEASTDAAVISAEYPGFEPRTYREISATYFLWAIDRTLPGEARLQAAGRSLDFARTAVTASPTDYLPWYALARAEALRGEWSRASLCMKRAGQLVMPGKQLELFK